MKPVDPHAYSMIEDSGRHAQALADAAKLGLQAAMEKRRRESEAYARAMDAARAEARRAKAAAEAEKEAFVAAARKEASEQVAAARDEAQAIVASIRAEANRTVADALAERDRIVEEVRGASARIAAELKQSRAQLSEVTLENETLKKNHVVLMQNQRRLYLAFVSLLKSVEDSCGAEIGVDQRIEATLLSSDIGGFLGEAEDLSTAKAREFLSLAGGNQFPSFQTETSHD